ncbi:hypothetical protein GZ78_28635 [Endozoicomonas numazuensis]|uniref:Immunity protein 45 domain-containing protein n=1 Tax=Endozoicomonas numazuensis TaxID=1137799 RepID=A0A081MZY1_9GAMM|nr:hypothetical protein GZ78_28635 [Endozoicomonas numazuensis]
MKLVDCNMDWFPHGTVFRLPGKYPYENLVDFMVYDPAITDRGQGLMVSSGYKAGLILVLLPKESSTKGDLYRHSIEKNWLIKNWSQWVYPECPVSEVYVSEGYNAEPISMALT